MIDLREFVLKNLSFRGDSIERLQEAISILLDDQFIIRSREKHYEFYEFIRRNESLVKEILALCGLALEHNRDYLFYYISTRGGRNRANLDRAQTIILLIFRLLYEEAMEGLKVIGGMATATNRDIHEKYRAFVNAEKPMEKTHLKSAMGFLKNHGIIDYEGAFAYDADFEIRILPTVMAAIDKTSLQDLQTKLKEFGPDRDKNGQTP